MFQVKARRLVKHLSWYKREAKAKARIETLDKAKIMALAWCEFYKTHGESSQSFKCISKAMKLSRKALKLSTILAQPRTSLYTYLFK